MARLVPNPKPLPLYIFEKSELKLASKIILNTNFYLNNEKFNYRLYHKENLQYDLRQLYETKTKTSHFCKESKEQPIDLKKLEKKNELEREKLNKMVRKLEIDLMNAKIDLLQEDAIKQKTITTTPYCNSLVHMSKEDDRKSLGISETSYINLSNCVGNQNNGILADTEQRKGIITFSIRNRHYLAFI